jgi:ubiquinone/menaquinone biosynthesis C-methylase UbiE
MGLGPSDRVVDVGCGDGSLLVEIAPSVASAMGVAPTDEEVALLRRSHASIRFERGLVEAMPFEDGCASRVICNGVLLLLPDAAAVRTALRELARITTRDGLVWVGEIPTIDELAQRREASRSRTSLLRHHFQAGGPREAFYVARRMAKDIIAGRPHRQETARVFSMDPRSFCDLAASVGLHLVERFPHGETRVDYLFSRRDARV